MGAQPWNTEEQAQQRRFFAAGGNNRPPPDSPLTPLPPIDQHTSLANLARPYHHHLVLTDHTTHTIDCFLSDLRLLARAVDPTTPIGTLQQTQVRDWVWSLRGQSGVSAAPKTIARRITFLHNLFGWLVNMGVVVINPVADLAKVRPLPPLPDLLDECDLARLLHVAHTDARCHLLILLALEGGLKKEEILALTLERVDISDPTIPTVAVRLPDAARTHRARLVAMPAAFTAIYQHYLRQYQPSERVFACTDRNLTYILTHIARRAQMTKRVTLQGLRDCFAVRLMRQGTPFTVVRDKLGLSADTWWEVQEKYRELAFPS